MKYEDTMTPKYTTILFDADGTLLDFDKAEEMAGYFREDLKHCRLITRNAYQGRTLLIRCKEQISRLLSPVL